MLLLTTDRYLRLRFCCQCVCVYSSARLREQANFRWIGSAFQDSHEILYLFKHSIVKTYIERFIKYDVERKVIFKQFIFSKFNIDK